jgi:ATP-dependent DNA helicase DinG
MSMAVEDRFLPAAAESLRSAIADAGGNEVFLLGTLDEQQRVASVRTLARGNRQAVPALLHVPRPGEVVIHNHPSGVLQPSEADLGIAANLGNSGVGSYIVDNTASAVYVVVEPHVPDRPVRLQVAELAASLAPGGRVSAQLGGYEHRPQQLRMLEHVTAAFNDDAILTVEAGTGTGKSLAYLVPAIAWSCANRERVIVSTHTINLQEQLVHKDLPFLTDRVGFDCTTALVKGRGNYLCQRKAAQAEEQGASLIEDEYRKELNELLAWAKRTNDGSLSDLSVRPRPAVWEQVVSENDNCLRARCPFYSECFFYTARRAAARADIVVVNHHLLMADLALREELGSYTQNAVLPPARRLLIDEAHHLEDVATNYFGTSLSYAAIERTFGRLRSQRHETKGVLPTLLLALDLVDGSDRLLAQSAARRIEERLLPHRTDLLVDAEQVLIELLESLEVACGRSLGGSVDEKIRVVPGLQETPFWERLDGSLRRLGAAMSGFAQEIDGVCERLDQMSEEGQKRVLFLATELRALQGRVAGFGAALTAFVTDDEGTCRWIEVRERPRTGKTLALRSAPIEVGPLLRKALFEQFPTVVLTSATLAVDRRFDFLHARLGLGALSQPERLAGLRLDSPFDFEEQALLAVPVDLPEPNVPSYEPGTHEAIDAVLQATGGGTFVLFTAYGALNRAFTALEPGLRARGLTVLRQGEANRQLLLRRFVQEPSAVLFATDSFWEGVDVPGDALRCVVITRLPFRVPTEPIEQARVETIEARGGNAFAEHTVPQAVIKLKQGFGRLIRSQTDRGAVVLLDSRVARKPYGRVFLDSLPPARRLVADRKTVDTALQRFFSGAAGNTGEAAVYVAEI